MNFTNYTAMILTLMLSLFTMIAHAENTMDLEAIEAESFSLKLDKEGYGFITARLCPACPEIKALINAETRISEQGKARSMKDLYQRTSRGATIMYDTTSRIATHIFW